MKVFFLVCFLLCFSHLLFPQLFLFSFTAAAYISLRPWPAQFLPKCQRYPAQLTVFMAIRTRPARKVYYKTPRDRQLYRHYRQLYRHYRELYRHYQQLYRHYRELYLYAKIDNSESIKCEILNSNFSILSYIPKTSQKTFKNGTFY